MRETISITKALADENRLRILVALKRGELCVCQIIALLGLAPSTVSKHMAILKHAGLVMARKEGRWTYFRLVRGPTPKTVQRAIRWVVASLEGSETVRADEERLAEIRGVGKEALCRTQPER